jgi:thiol-disulfide isomerase/thioredoxin
VRERAPRWSPIVPVVLGVLVVIAIAVYAWTQSHKLPSAAVEPNALPSVPPPIKVGARAPAFSVQTPLGAISNDTFAGKPYMLELFATWCPHCQRMTKVLRAIRARVPESKLAMVSVTGSPYGANSTPDNIVLSSQQDVDKFDATYGITWPSLYDPNMVVARAFGLNGFPTIFVVDARGKIVYSADGEVSQDTLMDAIHKAGA